MNKKASAEIVALTAISIFVLAIGFATLQDSEITGLVTSNVSINESLNVSDSNVSDTNISESNETKELNESTNISDSNETINDTEINMSDTNVTENNETEVNTSDTNTTMTTKETEDNQTFKTASVCGGEVPCTCGDTLNSDWNMTSDLINCSNGLLLGGNNITLDCNGYMIDGFNGDTGIEISNHYNVKITNCIIKEFDDGIYLSSSDNNTIEYINLSTNDVGIRLEDGSSNYLNKIKTANNNYYGIYLYNGSKNKLNDIISKSNNNYGIYLYSSNHNNISDAITHSHRNGDGVYIYTSKYNNLNNITTYNNSDKGINLYSQSNYNTILNSTTNNNSYGIYLSNSENNNISRNILYNNTVGSYLRFNCLNNILINNNASNNEKHGIYLYHSSQNNLSNNIVYNNPYYGIYIDSSSDYNNIINNTIKGNNWYGIHLLHSSNNILTENKLSDNSKNGIYLIQSSNNTLTNNTANNSNKGTYLEYSNHNSLNGNVIKNNSKGIFLESSFYNNLTHNIANNNSITGIDLYNSSYNDILNITTNNNTYGIYLNLSSNNVIKYSNSGFNSLHGVYLDSSSDNNLNNIRANFNNKTGIYLYSSSNNNITNSVVKNTTRYGIRLVSNSNNNKLINIISNSNGDSGIVPVSSSNNRLDNIIANSNNAHGIYLQASTYNNLTNLTANNNSYSGIILRSSSENILTKITANSNKRRGVYLFSSSENNLISLTTDLNNIAGVYIYSNSVNNTISHSTMRLNKNGAFINLGSNNNLNNITANLNNNTGIYIYDSIGNNITNSKIINNNRSGIFLRLGSNNNTIKSNIIQDNGECGINITSSNHTFIYNNIFNNTNNFFEDNASYENKWNTTKKCTSGNNILGKPCIGGNFWNDYFGKDTDGDWIGNNYIPHNDRDYLPLVLNANPLMSFVMLNSTYGANTTHENLTCWASSSDNDDDSITYHGFWYKNGVEQLYSRWNNTEVNTHGNTQGFGIAYDSKNNIYVAGYKVDSSAKKYRTIFKYNSSGFEQTFVAEIDSEDSEWFDVAVDKEDNIIAVGYSAGSNPNISIIKYDSSLHKIANYSQGDTSSVSIAQGVAVDSENNIIVTGYSNKSGDYDFLTMKFDNNLNLLWNKTYDFAGYNDHAMDVAVDSNNNIIVTGRTKTASNRWNFLTIKYGGSGNLIWNRTFDNSDEDRAYGVDVDSKDNIYVVGRTKITDLDMLLVKYTPLSGSKLWDRSLGGSADDSAQDISIDSRDNIVIGGWTNSYGAGQRDIWIIKYEFGNTKLNLTIGGTGNEYGYGIITDNYDDVIATGSTSSGGDQHMFTAKYGGFETGTYPPSDVVNVSTTESSQTTIGDNWSCEVISYDGIDYSSYQMSNTIHILPDQAPQWSNITTSPPSPATYSPGQLYQFNITWTDNLKMLDNVKIKHNFSGALQNFTMNNVSSEYYYNYIGLPVGNYIWWSYANDTFDNVNTTPQQTYTVLKANSSCSLTFIPPSGQDYPVSVNASCSCTNPETGPTLWRNISGTMTNVTSTENNQYVNLAAGNYNYICNISETQNYTKASNSSTYAINKYPTSCSLTFNHPNGTVYGNPINASCSCDYGTATLYRNGSDVTSTENNKLINLSAGNHKYICNVSGNQNYSSSSNTTIFTINKALTSINLSLNGAEDNLTIIYPQNITAVYSTNTLTANMYRDGTNINLENNTPVILAAGYYNYTVINPGNQNYSSSSKTYFANITKAITSCSLTFNHPNGTVYGNPINASCSCSGYKSPNLYRDGNNVTAAENNKLINLSAGLHNYTCNLNHQNYTGTNSTSINITKANSSVNLLLNGNDKDITVIKGNLVNVSAYRLIGEGNITLYINGNLIGSAVSYIDNISQYNVTGSYNATVEYPQTQNYTTSYETHWLTVKKKKTNGGGGGGGGGAPDNACEDGIDNDGDGLIDYPDDPGCLSQLDDDEVDCYTDIDCANNKICEAQKCVPCREDWTCTSWTPEKCPPSEIQTRTCEDLNNCGTTQLKPEEQKECEYIEPEDEKEEVEKPSVEKPQPPFISDKTKRIIIYSLSSVFGIALVILLIIILINKTNIYSIVGRQIEKGLPESKILKNIIKKGHSKTDAKSILKEAKIKELIKVISKNKAKGFSLDEIVAELSSKGWDKKTVEKVINRLK